MIRITNLRKSCDHGPIIRGINLVVGPDEGLLNRLTQKVSMVFQSFNPFPHLSIK